MRTSARNVLALIAVAGATVTLISIISRTYSARSLVDAEVVRRSPAVPDGREQDKADGDEQSDEKGPIAVFRDRRIVLKDKGRLFRLLIWAVFAQTALAAVLLAAQEIPQAAVSSGVPEPAGGTYAVPLASFLVAVISIAAGYCLALAGALRVPAPAGLAIVAAVTIALAVVPVSRLRVGGPVTGLHATEVWLSWTQLSVLVLLLAWAAWAVWPAAARRRGPAAAPDARLRPGVSFAGGATAVGAYYALELAIWGAYAGVGQAAAGTGFLLDALGIQTMLLPLLLILVVLLFSTDLLEWGEIMVRCTAARLRRARPGLFVVLTPLAAAAVVANALRLGPGAVPFELAAGAVLAGAAVLLVRVGARGAGWSDDIRPRAVIAGAVAFFAYTTALPGTAFNPGGELGVSPSHGGGLYWLVSIPLPAAVVAWGVLLLVRRRAGKPGQQTLGLVIVLAGMLTLVTALALFVPALFPRHFHTLSVIQLGAALAALAWAGWQLARRHTRAAPGMLADVFVLLTCLLLVTLIIEMLAGITALSAVSTYLLAGFFLILGFWGLITSGENLNKRQPAGAPYPRDARVMLLASFTVITNATALYLGTLHVPATGAPAAAYLTTDFTTPAGLGILGPVLVALAFLLRKRTYRPGSRTLPAAPVPTTGRAFRLAVAGALALAFVAGCSASPPTGPYGAPIPGPGCDKNGAYWSVPPGEPVSTHCTAAGLEVVAGPQGAGDVQFLPPGGSFSGNYRVSVQIEFSSLTDGCVSIYTRSSSAGHYTSYICTDQAASSQDYQWGMQRIAPSASQWLLALGELGPARTYTLEATAENADQQIQINGAAASAADATFTATKYIALGISNSGTQAGSAVFSHFTYTPLPAHPQPQSVAALPITTRDRVVVWYTDIGKPEIALLTGRLDSVGLAPNLAAQGTACAKLATAVTTARADPPVPDPAAQPWLTGALTEFGKAAADCQAGASSHNTALSDRAAAEIHAATADLKQLTTELADD